MSDPTIQSPAAYAMALLQRGESIKAIAVMRQMIEREPAVAAHHYHLSLIFAGAGQRDDAIVSLREAIRLDPKLAAAHLNLGVLLFALGDVAAAEQCFRDAIAAGQDDDGAWRNLGKALRSQDRLDKAAQAFRTALSRNPRSAEAWMMLGSVLWECGDGVGASQANSQAILYGKDNRQILSNECYRSYFGARPADILRRHKEWAAKFAPPASKPISRPLHDPIRVGYVSPNFRRHVVGAFMEPILTHHDRSKFAITCYSDTEPEDDLTARLRATDTTWWNTKGHSDQSLAAMIASDEIDILVDLTLHMRGSRLGVFALKPAPIQITHLAYCGTSGLPQMDYCVTDANMVGLDTEKFFTEKLLVLPTSYWCYKPPEAACDVGPLPMLRNGYVTFGSLNAPSKLNYEVIEWWSEILKRVPSSKLAIHVPGGSQFIPASFAHRGIGADRLKIYPRQSLSEYFQAWNEIDIALDPFPYNGGTTSLDALWMGSPLITLDGWLPLARAGVTILRNLNLHHLIAGNEERYVDIAAAWAADPQKLSSLRNSLRVLMMHSPLFDAPRYVAELEAAYRDTTIRRTI